MRLGVLDVGSNTVHLLVVDAHPGARPWPAASHKVELRLAEHLTGLGYPTYAVEYGAIGFGDRALGLEHWVDQVLPAALEDVSRDAGGQAVHPVGWCLGGIMLMLASAREPDLPLRSLAARFAAKEAVAKAMGAPPGMMWHHCWIPRPDHGDGRPTVHLTGTVQAQAEALGITHWHLSLSHDGDVATAYVVAERRAAEEESA